MGTSAKSLLLFFIIVCIGAAWVVWYSELPDTRWLIYLFLILAALLIAAYVMGIRRRDLLPDLLREIVAPYFECNGLSFAPIFRQLQDRCEISLFFQNRYDRPCQCRVALDPPARFWFGRLPLPSVEFTIECGGGELGVATVPYLVPPNFGGKPVAFEIGAKTKFPYGKGKLLRFREGMKVGPRRSATPFVARIFALLIGVGLSSPARWNVPLPAQNLPSNGPSTDMCTARILWRPGEALPGGTTIQDPVMAPVCSSR